MLRWPAIPVNGIVLGQVLSLLVTSTSSFSTELALRGVSIPFTQGAINYALLFIVFSGPVRLVQWRWEQAAWKYMLVSGIDVLSTGCIVKAFSLTSITSVTLLDSWTIPCVILLTAVVFKQRYTIRQMASAALAVSGLAVLLLFDDRDADEAVGRSSTLMGDALVLVGASGYAVNNVLSEHILKTGDAAELLGGIGCFGIILSAVLVPAAEYQAISHITWSWSLILFMAAYGIALFFFSLGMPILLHRNGSTVFNLSLLTSDLYAFTVRGIFFQGFSPQALGVYLLSCAMVALGLVLYLTSPDASLQVPASDNQAATNYAAVDLYDAYTSSDCGQLCVPEHVPLSRRSALSEDDDLGDGGGAIGTVREGGGRRGSGSKARLSSETGSSPRQKTIICSPVLSDAVPLAGQRTRIDETSAEFLEMSNANNHGVNSQGDDDVPCTAPAQARPIDQLEDVLEQ